MTGDLARWRATALPKPRWRTASWTLRDSRPARNYRPGRDEGYDSNNPPRRRRRRRRLHPPTALPEARVKWKRPCDACSSLHGACDGGCGVRIACGVTCVGACMAARARLLFGGRTRSARIPLRLGLTTACLLVCAHRCSGPAPLCMCHGGLGRPSARRCVDNGAAGRLVGGRG